MAYFTSLLHSSFARIIKAFAPEVMVLVGDPIRSYHPRLWKHASRTCTEIHEICGNYTEPQERDRLSIFLSAHLAEY